jgi:hypothetical protein
LDYFCQIFTCITFQIHLATGIGGINSPYYHQQLNFQNQGLIGTSGFQQLHPQYGEQHLNHMPHMNVNQNQQWTGQPMTSFQYLPNNQLNIVLKIHSYLIFCF